MESEIDSLILNIEVKGKDSGKQVNDLATAISALNSAINDSNIEIMSAYFDALSKSIAPIASQLKGVGKELENFSKISKNAKNISKTLPVVGRTQESVNIESKTKSTGKDGKEFLGGETYYQLQSLAEIADMAFNKVGALKYQMSQLNSEQRTLVEQLQRTQVGTAEYERLSSKLTDNKSKLAGLNKELAKAQKSNNGISKGFNSLFKSIGRVALYRAIRAVISAIVKAFKESIEALQNFDEEFGDTMSKINTDINKLKLSAGVAFYQILISIEPLITSIANSVADLANSVSKVMANMQGVSNYLKIDTEKMNELNSATKGTLLSFDTFTTLSSKENGMQDLLDTGDDALDEESFTEYEKALKELFSIFQTIWDILLRIVEKLKPLFEPVMEYLNEIFGLINTILDNAGPLIDTVIKIVSELFKFIAGAMKFATGLIKIFTGDFEEGIDSIGDGFKRMFESVINMFIGVINFIIDGYNLTFKWLNRIGKLLGKGDDWAQIKKIDYLESGESFLTSYAAGGVFEGAGTMYALAGESGAEVVATGSAGTGVLNVEQFADAMVTALVRYGAARDTGNGATIVLDGNKVGQLVASNVGFRNEANRRNAGLNWK